MYIKIKRELNNIFPPANIDGLIPGVRGQRAFPTRTFRDSDPFVMLDHIGPQVVGKDFFLDGKGHAHPHRGFETITFMFEGRMDHIDSLGNQASLVSGSVQRMNAGSGIIHGRDMASDPRTERFHEVQLWVNNPASEKMSAPDIHNVSDQEIPSVQYGNLHLRVISGELNGLSGPITTKARTQIAHLVADGAGEIEITGLQEGYSLQVYVLEGEAWVQGLHLPGFQLGTFSDTGDSLLVKTAEAAQLLIMAGQRLNEPIAMGGPFVMNTQEEILQANLDFQQGLFGQIN